MNLTITLKELAQEKPHKIKVNREVTCNECKGLKVKDGKTEGLTKCNECQGTGYSPNYEKYADIFGIKFSNECSKCHGLAFISANPCKFIFSHNNE